MTSQITGVSIVLLSRLFRRRSKKTQMLRVTGLCEGNAPVTGGFPLRKASDAENVSICHHGRRQMGTPIPLYPSLMDTDL